MRMYSVYCSLKYDLLLQAAHSQATISRRAIELHQTEKKRAEEAELRRELNGGKKEVNSAKNHEDAPGAGAAAEELAQLRDLLKRARSLEGTCTCIATTMHLAGLFLSKDQMRARAQDRTKTGSPGDRQELRVRSKLYAEEQMRELEHREALLQRHPQEHLQAPPREFGRGFFREEGEGASLIHTQKHTHKHPAIVDVSKQVCVCVNVCVCVCVCVYVYGV
jgi:hypothetical protein